MKALRAPMNSFGGFYTAASRLCAPVACAIILLQVLVGPSSVFAQGTNGILLATIARPTPLTDASFGRALAAVGCDRLLISSGGDVRWGPDIGSAYLFSANGTLLTVFTNPTPGVSDVFSDPDGFGASVATVGNDSILIGAPGDDAGAIDAGAAYCFNTNGTLMTIFTNPTPAFKDYFGSYLAGIGHDRVLIGAHRNDTGAEDSGAAYLFSTNGTLLTTFTNPIPSSQGNFGWSVAALGSDRVLVGGRGRSSVYVFSTNGTLLSTLTSPAAPANDLFGVSVSAVGNDLVLIGAPQSTAGSPGRYGVAYLFRTNGSLVNTIFYPSPRFAEEPLFGSSVAAAGSNRVLIAAFADYAGSSRSGAAYLFTLDGKLLTTFTNPTPAVNDSFGWSIATVGGDRLAFGAYGEDAGATNAGSVYLFSIPFPPLNITQTASTVSVGWVTPESGLFIEESGLLGDSAVWNSVTDPVSTSGPTNLVQQQLGTTNRFYRLRRP